MLYTKTEANKKDEWSKFDSWFYRNNEEFQLKYIRGTDTYPTYSVNANASYHDTQSSPTFLLLNNIEVQYYWNHLLRHNKRKKHDIANTFHKRFEELSDITNYNLYRKFKKKKRGSLFSWNSLQWLSLFQTYDFASKQTDLGYLKLKYQLFFFWALLFETKKNSFVYKHKNDYCNAKMDLFRDCLLYHCGFRDKNREKVLEFFGENAATNIAPNHHLPAISFLETRKTLVKKNLDKICVEGDEINTVPLPNEQLELAYAKERGENSIFDYETLHLYRKNSYEDVTLKVSENGHIQYNELTSLQRHKYLTDAVINSCHTVFKEQFVSNKCRVLSTFFLTKLFEIEKMKFDEIVELINLQQRWLYGKKDNVLFFENVEIILIPYNEYKHHWSLMYLDLVKGKVGMLDSSKYILYSTLKENISNILSFFITMNKFNNHGIECLQIENWDTKENLDLYCEPVPQQLDGYNCGVFVVMNVYKILENDGKLISFIQAKDADLCRKLLFDQLIDRHFKFGGKDKEGHNILSNKKPKSNLSFDRKAGPSVSEITDNVVGKSNKRIDKEKVFESSVSDNADTKVAQMPLQGKEDQPIEKENVSNKPQDTEKEISNPFSDITDASVNTREGAQSKNRPTSPAGDLNDLEEAQLDSNDAQEKVSSVAATTTSSNSNTRGKVAPTSPPTTDTDDSGGGTGRSSSEEEDSDNQSITNQAVATNTRKEKKEFLY